MRKEKSNLVEIEIEHYLQLMNIYLSEWDHRATALWNQVFKYFYATLFVLFLPDMANRLQVDLSKYPKWIFPGAALLLSFAFLFVSIGCAIRAKEAGNMYKNLVILLPEELRQVSRPELNSNQNPVKQKPKKSLLDTKCGNFFYTNMSYVICVLMFGVLAGLSGGAMILHYNGRI